MPLVVAWFLLVPADPFAQGWLFAWPLLFGAMSLTAVRWLPSASKSLELAIVPLVLSATVITGVFERHLCQQANLASAWGQAAVTANGALWLLGIVLLRNSSVWPFSRHREVVLGPSALGILGISLGTLLVQTSFAGDPAPLSFVPLLNPLDLSHVLALTACAVYLHRVYPSVRGELDRIWPLATTAVTFVVLNAVLARAVHHTQSVPYTFEQLWSSQDMQWVLSGAWTIVAVTLIFLSSRRGWRSVWIAASCLMALTVVKLFLVDLSHQSTVARIVTFMAVGVALLVVGWISPLPPRSASEQPLPLDPSASPTPTATDQSNAS
jgi:uncharacterized membrane protein